GTVPSSPCLSNAARISASRTSWGLPGIVRLPPAVGPTAHKKRARLVRVPRTAPRSGLARERVFRPDSAGREGRTSWKCGRKMRVGPQTGLTGRVFENRAVVIGRNVNDRRALEPAGFDGFDGLFRREPQLRLRAARLSQHGGLFPRQLMPVDDRK